MTRLRGAATSTLLSLLLALSVAGCSDQRTPEEVMVQAKAYMDKGEYRSAMIALSDVAQRAPNLMEARWLLAKAALMVQEGAKAEKEIRKAIELGQTPQAAQPLLAKAILLQGEPDRVLKETSFIPKNMNDANRATVMAYRAHALLALGKPEVAKPFLDEAIRLDPKGLEPLLGMAALHGLKREHDEARRWADQALAAHATSPDAWAIVGDLELARNRLQEAEAAFTKAIGYRSSVSQDTIKRALIRVQLKKYAAAQEDINQLQQQGFGKHPLVLYASGRLHYAQKQYAEAADAFEQSQALDADNRTNSLYLAVTYHLLGQQEKAYGIANNLKARAPNSPTLQQLMGSIQMSLDDYAAAAQTLSAALAKSPNDTNVLQLLATLSLLKGDHAKALDYASRWLALTPDSPEAKRQYMTARFIAGQSLEDSASTGGTDPYATELMLALDAFRHAKLADALSRADKLHRRYPDKAEPIKLKAAVYMAAAQWDKAKPELERALKLQPDDTNSATNLAKVELLKGNAKRAREILLPINKAKPGDEETVLLLSDVETRLGNANATRALLEQALQNNANALAVRAKLAETHLGTGNYQSALELTRNVSDTQFKQQPALMEIRGKALLQSGDALSARRVYEQWAKFVPQSPLAHFNLAQTHALLGNAAESRKALAKAIALGPKYLPARIAEVRMLVQSRQIEPARKALATLRKDFGDTPDVLGLQGWFELGMGEFAAAESHLASALKHTQSSELAMLLARAQMAQKKTGPALKTMNDWLRSHPKDIPMQMHLAGTYLGSNRADEARAVYARIVEIAPEHVPALNNLAWLTKDKDLNQAIKLARQAETLAPRDPNVQDTLGMLLFKQGDNGAALRLLQQAARSAPKDPRIQLHYGQILASQQRNTEARIILRGVLKLAPNSPQATQAQALLGTLR